MEMLFSVRTRDAVSNAAFYHFVRKQRESMRYVPLKAVLAEACTIARYTALLRWPRPSRLMASLK